MGSVQAQAFESWDGLAQQARGLLAGENHRIANAANLAALIFNSVPDLNWAGFYFVENGELVVGPFQGQPACVRIAPGKGVCVSRLTSAAPQTPLPGAMRTQAGWPWNGPTTSSPFSTK